MDKLNECRERIDEIDSKIIELYEERMNIVKEVISYKLENDYPILDASREAKMLEKNLSKIKNEEFKTYYKDVLSGYLKASKDMQKNIISSYKKH